MAGKKGKPHRRERIKEYYKNGRFEENQLKKRIRHEDRIDMFKNRKKHFEEVIPPAVNAFLTTSVLNQYIGKLSKQTYTELVDQLAQKIRIEKDLPKGRVKQYLRTVLPKP